MQNPIVNMLLSVIAYCALALCVITPILVFTGTITFQTYMVVFNIASLGYILSAPFCFGK